MPRRPPRLARKKNKLRARRHWLETLERRLPLDSTVVFSEIMYHPAGDNTSLEWIELNNQQGVNMDISGWSLQGGVDFTFPAGTVVPGGSYLVVAASPSALQAASGYSGAFGPFVGQLSNSGESLRLVNNSDRTMDQIVYGDDGDWPVGPDGSGHSLIKKDPMLGSGEPANWTLSREIGGTPGARNFPSSTPQIEETKLVDILGGVVNGVEDRWKYFQSGYPGSDAWRGEVYDDSGWSSGAGLFYVTPADFGAVPKSTPLTIGQRTYYFRTTFNFDGDLGQVTLKLRPFVDDGAVYYLNGQPVYWQNMPLPPATIDHNTLASPSVGNASFTGPFTIPKDSLRVGVNTLAVEVHQGAAGSPDVVFGMELIASEVIPPPVDVTSALRLNEIAGATEATFRLELFNPSAQPVDLAGMVVTHSGLTSTDYVLPAQSLAAGQYLVLNQSTLGFDPLDGDKIFLYFPSKSKLIDGLAVKPTARGRSPEGTGDWFYTSAATFGAANSIQLNNNIVINEIMYNHRPQFASPAEYTVSPIFSVDGVWKYHDQGSDLGTDWRAAAYDDDAWPSGAGLLYNESANLPAPKNTLLAPGRSTYYFRKAFNFSGSLAGALLQLQPLVDDGAVFYLNGQEVYRVNMPEGPVSYSTSASAVVPDAAYGTVVTVPATGLVVGENTLAVEVHQASAPSPGTGPSISPAAGYSMAWDGSNGDFFTTANPAPVPDNAAYTAGGQNPTTAFGSSEYGAGIHLIANINDGRYGNSESWIADFEPNPPPVDNNPYIGLNFNRSVPITSIAWGRDNGNTVADACGGTCSDRSAGTYTIQITNVGNPGTSTAETGDPATGWKTISAVTIAGASAGFTPHLRHRYVLSEGGNPVAALGLRIKVSSNTLAIDELEINAATDPGNADVVFGTSLATAVETKPAQEFTESTEEWIELYNRGATAVNLTGWRLDEGIDYNFPAGTTIPAGGYLVVAKDAVALQAKFPGITAIGSFGSNLSNSGDRIVLKDARNNPADEVRYFDGGRWAGYADGSGSSLELRDPDSDNSKPEAWAASEESSRSSWETYTYRGTAIAGFPPDRWNEFVLGLFGDGEVLLDDIRVVEFPGGAATQKLQNGTFETDTVGLPPAAWRINGNERASRVVTDPTNPSNKVLHLTSTGQTSDRFNHAETTFIGNQPAVNGRDYEISFKAKWLAGTNQLNTRLYFNRLAKRWSLDVPEQSGTPGTQNSRFQANAGPTYLEMKHLPVLPAANEAVAVSIRAADPDGIASMNIKYSVNGGALQTAVMSHQGGGLYTGSILGQAASAIVQFYVEGQDALGAVSTFPRDGTASRALYEVQDNQAAAAAGKHTVRIVMTAADSTFMHDPINLLSSEEMGATVIYNESEVYYDVGVSLKGSMAARPNPALVGFRLKFDPSQKFRGVHEEIELDRSGRGALVAEGQDEILVKHLMQAAGDIPGMYDDLAYVIAPRTGENGDALLMMSPYGDVFLDSQFEDGGDGEVFNFDLIYYQNSTHNGSPEGFKLPTGYGHPMYNVDLEDLGNDKELYRWHFQLDNNRTEDDYSRLIEFLKAMSLPAGGTGSPLDVATQELMDVDEWMRMFAAQSLAGVGLDIYGRGLPHNLKLYVRPEDGRVLALPWDMDLSVFVPSSVTADPFPGGNLRKVIDIPGNKRVFWGHLHDLMNSQFNSTYLAPWVTHYTSLLPNQNFSAALTYLNNRGSYIASQLPATIAFRADYTGPNPVNSASITVAGDAWINVKEIRIAGRDEPIKPTFSTVTGWTATVPLESGNNTLTFQAVDYKGNVIATDTVNVTNTLPIPSQLTDLRITEVMYNPAFDARFDGNDLEFIELTNIGQSPLPLANAELSGAASFIFPNITLNPGQFVLIVGDEAAFETKYGAGLPVIGALDGNLSNGAEKIILSSDLGQVIHDFTYNELWHPTTDGDGYSLVIRDDRAALTSWTTADGWRASSTLGGSPGAADTLPGATIAGRHVFYNNSKFDDNNAAASAGDDAAIATDKVALLPGGTSSFVNYTSFNRGLNGIMVDIAGLPLATALTASDFEFRVGNTDTPSAWSVLAAAPTISQRPGAGAGGSNRVTLIWPTGAAIKQWLQVTVKANANTGLATPDVFYFGSAVGESGNVPGDYGVSITDELLARNNPVSINPGTTVINRFDYNRDGTVSVVDQLLARNNITTAATRLRQITAPSLLQGGQLQASSLTAQGLNDSHSDNSTDDVARGLLGNERAGEAPAGPRSTAPSSAPKSTSLQPQALSAAYAEAETLVGKRRASMPAADVDSDLLELLARPAPN